MEQEKKEELKEGITEKKEQEEIPSEVEEARVGTEKKADDAEGRGTRDEGRRAGTGEDMKKKKPKDRRKSQPKVKPEKVAEKITEIPKEEIEEKGKEVLQTIGKGLVVGVRAITAGVKVAGKFTERVAGNANAKIQIMKLNQKVKKLHSEIGAEICSRESEGKKEINLDKGEIQKLIKQVRDTETKIEEIRKR